MATATVELTKEEIAQRGKEIYYNDILPFIETGNNGRVVAIDVLSGQFELADDAIISSKQLRDRLTDPVIFFMRIGYPTMARVLSSK